MIIGLGLDSVEISRIQRAYARFAHRFVQRILNKTEEKAVPAHIIPYLAARFAAKEAAVKALGTGIAQGIGFHDITITNLPTGAPKIHFSGQAFVKYKELGVKSTHISLTHSQKTAAAVVILEG